MPTARIPSWLPKRYAWHWQNAWTTRASRHPGFRHTLAKHKMLSPHFSYAEANSKDGVAIPRQMRARARNLAFRLEQLRHELGDIPIPITSWYRSPARNRAVGGAAKSKHMEAIAVDIPVEFVKRHLNFDQTADRIFREGGFGQYPAGARHVDVRGSRARWTSFTPGR